MDLPIAPIPKRYIGFFVVAFLATLLINRSTILA
jgi:hypothetical protein